MKKAIMCKVCGEVTHTDDELRELNFKWLGEAHGPTSEVSCPGCGTRTIQRAWDTNWQGGHFLIIKPRIRNHRKSKFEIKLLKEVKE